MTGVKRWGRLLLAGLGVAFLMSGCDGSGGSGTEDPGPTAPVLTAQPSDAQAVAGSDARFTAAAQGSSVTWAWQRSTDGGTTWVAVPNGAAASLVLTGVTMADTTTRYRAVASNAGLQTFSSAALLTVSPEPEPPRITVDLSAQSVVTGSTVTFAVTATGTALQYQWQSSRDGNTWVDVAGATAATLQLQSVAIDANGTLYRVVVRNTITSVTSAAVLLTVAPPPAAPVMTLQPVAVSVTAPNTATFTATASGQPAPTLQWQRSTNNGTTYVDIAGANQASYTTGATALTDSGTLFRLVASNSVSTATSTAVALTVSPTQAPPVATTQPADATVPVGQTATFTAAFSGVPTPTYQWQFSADAGATFANINGATGSSYSVVVAQGDNGKRYRVVASNSVGTATSRTLVLTVPALPLIGTQPVGTTVNQGQVATFSVQASSFNGSASYQWKRNGTDISGATASSYTTAATSATDDGVQFTVAVTNTVGTSLSVAAVLKVNSPPAIGTAPQSANQFVGQTATFSVVATGTAPLTYQWVRGGTAISGATASSYTTPALTLADDGSSYAVVVSNAAGSITSALALLGVSRPPELPSITTQPQDTTVFSGRTATFTVVAGGTAPLSYQWRRNGTPITGATAASYTTPALAWTDTLATYSVVVSNTAGEATSREAVLQVTPRVVEVSVGGKMAAARKEDGTVWGWGDATLLGNGNNGVPYGTMVRAMNIDGTLFSGVRSISNGYEHTLALKSDGSLWAWGSNTEGELGIGTRTATDSRPYPTRVLTNAGGNPLADVTAISGGWRYSMALKTDGTVWGWGYALSGRLGNNNNANDPNSKTQFPSPQQVLATGNVPLTGVTKIVSRDTNSLAMRNDGTVWIWGSGQAGRLGDGQRNSSAIVAQRLNDASGAAIASVVGVASGYDHSLVLKGDGTAFAWGSNSYGQLGDGTSIERTTAVLVKDANGNPFNNIANIQAGEHTTAFLRSDGTVWMSGRNVYGQIGNGTTTNALVPTQVRMADGSPLTGVVQVALFDNTVIVLRNDGSVWGWGGNQSGELGYAPTNQVQSSMVPVRISVSGF